MKTSIRYSKIWLHTLTVMMICSLMLVNLASLQAQSKTRTRLKAYYERLPDNKRKVSVVLTQGSGRSLAFVENAEVLISTFDHENEIELTSLTTDLNGESFLLIDPEYPFIKDEEGYYTINTKFEGNDTLKAADKLIKFKDLNIELSFQTEDTLKTLTVSTFELDSAGNHVPAGELDLNIGVERLYSILFIEKVETNEEGVATMVFPNDIPGDSTKAINVVARIDEDDNYGTVTSSSKINWGITPNPPLQVNERSLFGDEAPLWMIISVFVILSGAFYHFVLAVIKLYKMRNLNPDLQDFNKVINQ